MTDRMVLMFATFTLTLFATACDTSPSLAGDDDGGIDDTGANEHDGGDSGNRDAGTVPRDDAGLDQSATCGNGILDDGEVCDGTLFAGARTCAGLDPLFAPAPLGCSDSCELISDDCAVSVHEGVPPADPLACTFRFLLGATDKLVRAHLRINGSTHASNHGTLESPSLVPIRVTPGWMYGTYVAAEPMTIEVFDGETIFETITSETADLRPGFTYDILVYEWGDSFTHKVISYDPSAVAPGTAIANVVNVLDSKGDVDVYICPKVFVGAEACTIATPAVTYGEVTRLVLPRDTHSIVVTMANDVLTPQTPVLDSNWAVGVTACDPFTNVEVVVNYQSYYPFAIGSGVTSGHVVSEHLFLDPTGADLAPCN
jgi:hypothetical protein